MFIYSRMQAYFFRLFTCLCIYIFFLALHIEYAFLLSLTFFISNSYPTLFLSPFDSARGCVIEPLRPEHAELINSTWKYGGDADSYNSVLRNITQFPSLCVIPENGSASGSPVSWVLLCPHGAMGLLYTLPEYRRRGYARTLVSRLSEMLFEEGYPVYCIVEEGNSASYGLFRSLGFTEKQSYRAVWFEINGPHSSISSSEFS